jgi:hypothetical protein
MARRTGALACVWALAAGVSLAAAPPASAGSYSVQQCSASVPSIAPGYSAFSYGTLATAQLSNSCASRVSVGTYVFTNGQAGAVTENGSSGSQVGLGIGVPDSAPHVWMKAIDATVIGSSVTGDDAFLGFASAGQALPGGVELPYGGSDYVANESWNLPQNARDFEAYVNCTTDRSSPTCIFADAASVPALSNITLTLAEDVPPSLASASGTLLASASGGGSVSGAQSVGFTASDVDSGVYSAVLHLTPQGGGSAYAHEFAFASSCAFASWNACPLAQSVGGFVLDTASLHDGSYVVDLAVTDAAGNTATTPLGTVVSHNAPVNSAPPSLQLSGGLAAGTTLSASVGAWSSPSAAGNVSYAYQWERCDARGQSCTAIAGATQGSYTIAAAENGHTLRVAITASNGDGATVAVSACSEMVGSAQLGTGTPGSPGGAGSDPGAPNGWGAEESARVRIDGPGRVARTYGRRAFKMTGQLLARDGQPIAGASLDVLQQIVGQSQARLIGRAKTGADGSFAIAVPAGPSRSVEVGYRAFSNDPSYSAESAVAETVAASVSLKVSPRRTSAHGKIVLAGRVQGPIARGGAKVELLVHYHGEWVPFKTRFTDAKGRFKVAYEFKGSEGVFPFRAIVPRGQTALPFGEGKSPRITVATGGVR